MADYFSHDYHARHDPKMQHLLQIHGLSGIGLFWSIAEFCYEQGGYIKESECECIAFDMRTHCEQVLSVLNDFQLFEKDGDTYYSKSILRRLEMRKEKSEKASNSAKKRWSHANAMRTQCDGNAIKESKVKESKVNTHTHNKPIWFTDYNSYLKECLESFNVLQQDREFIVSQQLFHPRLDIRLSMKKMYSDYWGTEAGWKKKKAGCRKDGYVIDWRRTIINGLAMRCNQVWNNQLQQQTEFREEPISDSFKGYS